MNIWLLEWIRYCRQSPINYSDENWRDAAFFRWHLFWMWRTTPKVPDMKLAMPELSERNIQDIAQVFAIPSKYLELPAILKVEKRKFFRRV